uniref:CCD97-like C-terminal domain-containing protein n=1 Tax=Phasianus colchicus TaxID=9054 RepID=A0A669QLA9_PHACC
MKEDPPSSNETPAAGWDPKVPPEGRPVEERDPRASPTADPTAEPDPKASKWIPVDPPDAEEDPPLPTAAVEAMLAAVAASPVRVRSQQQGDPELTAAERHRELRALFLRKPLVFLERFHGALRAEHLPCFAHLPPCYEVAFYCRQVRGRRRQDPETGATRWPRRPGARTRLRNRRYAALRQLIAGSFWFSVAFGVPLRVPLASGIPQTPPPPPNDPPSSLVTGGPPPPTHTEEDEDEDEAEGPHIPDAGEREVLREEFRSRMYQRFLDGEDGDFDYSQVDENPDMDNLDIESRDAEERYFDE